MKIMKTLSIGGNTYEIFDAKARSDIEALKKSGVAGGSGSGSGGVTSWNDLTDKPFEVAAHIYEYNANTTYDEVIVVSEEDSLELVKISDDIVEPDMFIGGSIDVQVTLEGETLTESMPITEDLIKSIDGMYVITEGCIVVTAESIQYPFDDIDLVIPRGVWTANLAKTYPDNFTIEYVRFLSRSTPLPESVIPDTIARVEDITWENIPDKPFYNSYVEVIPEQTYRIYRDADNLDTIYNIISMSDAYFEKIEEGKTYSINAFGSTVTCVAQKIEYEWFTGIILGNPYWAGASTDYDNGLDFAVMYRENDDGTVFKKIRVTTSPVNGTFGVQLVVPICLDESFIPSAIARTDDVIQAPVSAIVGQTVVVKAIDENGRPTEWECVDLPTGGSDSGGGLPTVTEADNGKILTVVNGVWTAVEMPIAEEAEF